MCGVRYLKLSATDAPRLRSRHDGYAKARHHRPWRTGHALHIRGRGAEPGVRRPDNHDRPVPAGHGSRRSCGRPTRPCCSARRHSPAPAASTAPASTRYGCWRRCTRCAPTPSGRAGSSSPTQPSLPGCASARASRSSVRAVMSSACSATRRGPGSLPRVSVFRSPRGPPARARRPARPRATWKSRWWPMTSARYGRSASATAASGSGISRSSSSRPARRSTRPASRRCATRPSGCARPWASAAPGRPSSESIR